MIYKLINLRISKLNTRGSVLLESIIAITVVTVGLLGILSLLSNSLGLMRVISDRYSAVYLASEGIEVVKNLIDSNVLAGRPWNAGMDSGEYEVEYNSGLMPYTARLLSFDKTISVYRYGGGEQGTKFRRKIQIERRGSEEIRVNSLVDWVTRGSAEFSVNLEDHFLNNK